MRKVIPVVALSIVVFIAAQTEALAGFSGGGFRGGGFRSYSMPRTPAPSIPRATPRAPSSNSAAVAPKKPATPPPVNGNQPPKPPATPPGNGGNGGKEPPKAPASSFASPESSSASSASSSGPGWTNFWLWTWLLSSSHPTQAVPAQAPGCKDPAKAKFLTEQQQKECAKKQW